MTHRRLTLRKRRRLTPQRERPGLRVHRRAMVGEQGGTDTEGKAPSSRSSSSNRRSDEEAEEVSPGPTDT